VRVRRYPRDGSALRARSFREARGLRLEGGAELDIPDPFYMKVLNDRTVTFMVPEKLLLPMMKAARARRKWDGPRP
jgi:hypothetical protein